MFLKRAILEVFEQFWKVYERLFKTSFFAIFKGLWEIHSFQHSFIIVQICFARPSYDRTIIEKSRSDFLDLTNNFYFIYATNFKILINLSSCLAYRTFNLFTIFSNSSSESENYFDASVSKIINLCIYDLAENEKVVMCKMYDLEKHSVILRKSALECLNEMKRKYNLPIYVLINVAIREGIEKLEKKIEDLPLFFYITLATVSKSIWPGFV